jgi:hypothetical protein
VDAGREILRREGRLKAGALLARKELARARALEALGFYQALLRALVELFGMAHRPERFDNRREAARCGAGSRHAVT